MENRTSHYAIRRLNPFLGVIQVLELDQARALSPDGVHWEIQILAPRPEHSWHSPNQHAPVMSYFRFGVWSRQRGLTRVPVSPILDLETLLSQAEEIQAALSSAQERLPFPLADNRELWLLDPQRRPVALIASTREEDNRPRVQPWTASARSEHGFCSASLSACGIPEHDGHNPRRHAYELEQRVRRRVGSPAGHAWVIRDQAGRRRPERTDARVSGEFPELLITRQWDAAADAELVDDYLDWCAPYLLTLPDLGDPTRERLERAAAKRAVELARQFTLYPRVIDRRRIDAARVEARMRQGTG